MGYRHERAVTGNHQMSKMQFKDKTGKVCAYYFDPTWDCGTNNTGRSEYFCFSKEEMEDNEHHFTIADSNNINAERLQQELYISGYLYSRYNGHERARERNKIKGLNNEAQLETC